MRPEKMERLVTTDDGSHTLYSAHFEQSYHSVHGALAESQRVFLELGFEWMVKQKSGDGFLAKPTDLGKMRVLEMGFGTGLNTLLTWLAAEKYGVFVQYMAIEAYPIAPDEVEKLNYDRVLNTSRLVTLHGTPWNDDVALDARFSLEKKHTTLEDFLRTEWPPDAPFDLVYFDAFAPDVQPELWTPEVFSALAQRLKPGGALTTYSAKGSVRRALQAAGFRVEKHPGPVGKREVVRAIKV